jgi:uncharacterized protein (TIGR02271 family)
MQLDQLQGIEGSPVYDEVGEQIGKVEEVFVDVDSREPEWIGLGTGFLGTKRVLVPVQGAQLQGDGLSVPYAKEHVKDAPDLDGDQISPDTERDLYAFYGLGSRQPAAQGEGEQAAMTRHEEELAVGTQQVEAGRARLHKWVETEPVELDVELRQETARVTREPVDQPVGDAELGEESVEVPLSGERPVVQKQTVAKERVGVQKDVATERQTIQDEVRKERVEVEGDVEDA